MKKFAALLLVLATVLTLAACGEKEEAAAISAAIDAVSADTGLQEAAQELYRRVQESISKNKR